MKNVFISFSSLEISQATHICDLLEANGFTCFVANRDLVPGKEYAEQLVENMDVSGVVVLLLSQASNNSPHVLREIEYAVSHKIPILVYKLEEVSLSKSMEYFLMTHQWIADAENKEELLVEGVSAILKEKKKTAKRIAKNVTPSHQRTYFVFYSVIAVLLVAVITLSVVVARLTVKNKILENTALLSENVSSGEDIESDNTEETPDESVSPVKELELGDTITFGTYYDAPIEWRVLRKNEDGTVVLISKYLLTMKTFDAPEGGEYNKYDGNEYGSYENHVVTDESLVILIRGNNDWSKCNLRTWLNSDDEVVIYPDYPPTYTAIGKNYYNTEPGFLHSFTAEEKAALVTVENKSTANTFSENVINGQTISEDKVYILSSDELVWFDEAGISMYAIPTEECKAHDEYILSYESFVNSYHTETYFYWLRDNESDAINHVYVTTTENISSSKYKSEICGCSLGVRPVITIDPDKLPVCF